MLRYHKGGSGGASAYHKWETFLTFQKVLNVQIFDYFIVFFLFFV